MSFIPCYLSVFTALAFFVVSPLEAAGIVRILVTPLSPVSPEAPAWVATAVQSDLMAELANLADVQAVRAIDPVADDNTATTAARAHHADTVLYGSYQMIDGQLRFDVHLLEVAGEQRAQSIKVTGLLRDLFSLEDQLASQVRGFMETQTAPIPEQASAQAAAPTTGPVRVGAYGPYGAVGLYDGSSLQRAMESGRVDVPAPPKLEGEGNSSYAYRYGTAYWMNGFGYPYFYYPYAPTYVYPRYWQVVPPRLYTQPRRTLPPSNVQGYFPMTLTPTR